MLVGDHEGMAAVQEAPGMRGWGWAAVRASEESQDCWCLGSLTHSQIWEVWLLCPRLTIVSVKWVVQRGRVIVVLQEQMLADWCSD